MTQRYGSPWAYAAATGGITDTGTYALAAAAGGALRNYLCSLQFANKSAVASEITILDGATVIWRGYCAASQTLMNEMTFDPPLKGSTNTAMNVSMVTTGTATFVSAQGFVDN
jgi:hypothetical protein